MHARVDHTAPKGRGAVAVDHFTFQHNVDLATVALLQKCQQNYLVPKVTFVMRKAAGSAPLPYVEILFQQVRLVDISMGQTAVGAGLPLESVTFAFERVSFDYTPQSRKGAGKGRHNFSWSIPSAGIG
jgi:type VI secretion system secreted protein Hcp